MALAHRSPTLTRLDPLDPSPFRHGGGCEHRDTSDSTIIRAILRIKEVNGYWYVECVPCAHGWQAAYYAEERVG